MIRERSIINYSLNFVSSILLIFISKYIFRRYPISSFTLTILNSFFSSFYATIALHFVPAAPPSSSTRPKTSFFVTFFISMIFSIFLLFSNFSLLYNSIGTYEIFKTFVPPILMIFECIQLFVGLNSFAVTRDRIHRDYSFVVFGAFLLMIIGTVTNISFDANFHPIGLVCGSISVIVIPIYQTLIQGEASNTIYDRTRFLQIQSFLSATILLPFWPLTDETFSTIGHVFVHFQPIFLFGLTGFLAFIVNASAMWCIKDDAATGYNMIGQLKIVLVIFLGSALFREKLTLKQLFSLLGTIVGSMIYVCVSHGRRQISGDVQ